MLIEHVSFTPTQSTKISRAYNSCAQLKQKALTEPKSNDKIIDRNYKIKIHIEKQGKLKWLHAVSNTIETNLWKTKVELMNIIYLQCKGWKINTTAKKLEGKGIITLAGQIRSHSKKHQG